MSASKPKNKLAREYVQQLLDYGPTTGIFLCSIDARPSAAEPADHCPGRLSSISASPAVASAADDFPRIGGSGSVIAGTLATATGCRTPTVKAASGACITEEPIPKRIISNGDTITDERKP